MGKAIVRYIRWFLCALFVLGAGLFTRAAAMTVMAVVHVPERLVPLRPMSVAASLAMPALAMIYIMACWTFLRGKPSARGWGIAASTTLILLAALMEWVDWHFGGAAGAVSKEPMLTLGTGLTGIFAFSRRDAVVVEAGPKPQAGDGTRAWTNRMMWLVAAVAFLAVSSGWSRWAEARGLERATVIVDMAELIGAALVVLTIHEAGHAVAGMAMKMRVCTFGVGPVLWSRWSGRWRLSISGRNVLRLTGLTQVVPTRLKTFRRDKIVEVVGGPAATLISGGVALGFLLTAPGHAWAPEWNVLKLLVTLSLVAGLVNLVPFRMGRGHSDGAKLYQMIRGEEWADYWLTDDSGYASWATPIRARQYDIAAILRAAGTIAQGAEETQFLLMAVAHYFDVGQLEKARQALEKAEAKAVETEAELPADLMTALVFFHAFLVGDDVRAWEWWEKALEKDPGVAEGLGAASLCALLIAQDQLGEAEEAWIKAEAWTRNLPQCGAANMEREVVWKLRSKVNQMLEEKKAGALKAIRETASGAEAKGAKEQEEVNEGSSREMARAALEAAQRLSMCERAAAPELAESKEEDGVETPVRRWHDDAALAAQ